MTCTILITPQKNNPGGQKILRDVSRCIIYAVSTKVSCTATDFLYRVRRMRRNWVTKSDDNNQHQIKSTPVSKTLKNNQVIK